jgi:hypothetical protein
MKQNQNLRDQGQFCTTNNAKYSDLQEDEHMIKPHPVFVIC